VVSEPDPVASRVAERWGTPPSTGDFVEGVAIRELSPSAWVVRRPGPHVHDEGLDLRLPEAFRAGRVPLVFPSIHRSEQNLPCLTVHPLGNMGAIAEIGGVARTLCPTDPFLMAGCLRQLAEGAPRIGLAATFESTHHGPHLELPALFVEIGYGHLPGPPEPAVQLLADVLPGLVPSSGDRVALAVGGGHYAPHFTDLVLRRRWAFGHIVSRHALSTIDAPTAREAFRLTAGAEGVVFARAGDAALPALGGVGPRLRDAEAPEIR